MCLYVIITTGMHIIHGTVRKLPKVLRGEGLRNQNAWKTLNFKNKSVKFPDHKICEHHKAIPPQNFCSLQYSVLNYRISLFDEQYQT